MLGNPTVAHLLTREANPILCIPRSQGQKYGKLTSVVQELKDKGLTNCSKADLDSIELNLILITNSSFHPTFLDYPSFVKRKSKLHYYRIFSNKNLPKKQ